MGRIPDDIINQVVERSDIAAVIGQYVPLKKAGRNFKALCPFHHEKSPSFVVNPDKQIYHCFGCGAGGNVVGFIMQQERLAFPEALRFLADKAGVEIPESQSEQGPDKQIRDRVIAANEAAAQFFHQQLLNSRTAHATKARDYLKNRGIDLSTVTKFNLGFAPEEWDALISALGSKGFEASFLETAGLAIARDKGNGFYDRFRNRIMFPICDVHGRTVAFGGRALTDEVGAKYINSPQTPVYTKGQHLFGFSLTKAAVSANNSIIVVEGYMDMIMPFVHGVDGIAACLGTAMTDIQIRLIRRYTPNVVMLFDSDAAGQSAIVRSLDLLVDENMNVRVVTLSENEDPDSFIRTYGVARLKERLDNALSLFDYKISWLRTQHDDKTIDGRSAISTAMLSTINRTKHEVVKFELTKKLADALNLPMDVLTRQASKMTPIHVQSQASTASELPQSPKVSHKAHEELMLALILSDYTWLNAAKQQVSVDDFEDTAVRALLERLWPCTNQDAHSEALGLMGHIPDEQIRTLVTRLLAKDAQWMGEPSQVFADCVARIKRDHAKNARARLMVALKHAEQAADAASIDELRAQLNELLKQKHSDV